LGGNTQRLFRRPLLLGVEDAQDVDFVEVIPDSIDGDKRSIVYEKLSGAG
jgi:hypothetical protein